MPFTKQQRRLTWAAAIAGLAIVAGGASWLALHPAIAPAPQIVVGDGQTGPLGMAWVPGGTFQMGSNHKLSQANERPAHAVRVDGFWMDQTHVTNDQFA